MLRHEVVGIAVCVSCLLACAQSEPGNSADRVAETTTQTPAPTSMAPLPAVRVVVQFKQPVAFQSESFLHHLQVQTQAQARYLGAVSPDTHIYSFQPRAGQTYAQLLQLLSAMREVARAELDQKAKAN